MEKAYCSDRKCNTEVITQSAGGLSCPVCSKVMSRLQHKPTKWEVSPSAAQPKNKVVVEAVRRKLSGVEEQLDFTIENIKKTSMYIEEEQVKMGGLLGEKLELEQFLEEYETPRSNNSTEI